MLAANISSTRLVKNNQQRMNTKHINRTRSQDAVHRSKSPALRGFFPYNADSEEQNQDEDENEDQEVLNIESEHQVACPWNKVKRLRSREHAKSPGKDDLHPRPWGVRSPKDIHCTCKISQNDRSRFSRTTNTSSICPTISIKSPAHIEMNRGVDGFCKQVEKIKINLTKDEVSEIIAKIKSYLEKKMRRKERSMEKNAKQNITVKRSTTAQAAHQAKLAQQNAMVPVGKESENEKPMSAMSAIRHSRGGGGKPMENIILTNQGLTMTPTAVVGTMESTNYVIELKSQPVQQNAGEINNLMNHVIPMVEKPKLVTVDGAYFAEVPNNFGVNQVRPDSGVMRKRTENVTFYALADQKHQNVTYAKPKSPFSKTSKYVPVTKLPALTMHQPSSRQIVRK